ncbi:MAG TPA: O-antigen ligase family protein [Solirubrobacteraceae bacterium]|nr:O-antigen ligase family protein [Solirubrobacteraceae bacterium]
MDAAAISAWSLAFGLVTYLSLRGGGYDIVVRSEAAVAVWWVILLGALAGILPTRFGVRGWVPIALLTGFAAWTGLAIGWSSSAEQSVIEVGRIAAYLGVLVLAIAIQGRTAARHAVSGLACAIGLVTVLAVLSRLHPQAFGPNLHFQFLGPNGRKLSYPLGYWNALADFVAMGVPLLLAVAVQGRTIAGRAAAAATLPLTAMCVYLTISRGGVIALVVGIAVFLLLVPRRLETIGTLLVGAAGAAILLRATAARPAVTSAATNHAGISQGTQLIWITAGVCLVVAALQVGISLAATRLERPPMLTPDRRTIAVGALALALVMVVAGVAAGLPGKLDHAWHDFKQPPGAVVPTSDNDLFARLQAANGNSRYQYWQSAVHAAETHPWRGIGPGTFQFWWAQHATGPGTIRNAHSLYFETLAETGIIGLALLGGMLLWFAGIALRRALREPPELRVWLAGASASLAVFLFAAAVEWVWQLAAIAATALILGAVIVAGRGGRPADGLSPGPPIRPEHPTPGLVARILPRAGLVTLAAVALGAVLVPLAGQLSIRASQAAVADRNLPAALADSLDAQRVQPYSSSAHLQEALVFEAAGELRAAAGAARIATTDSPTDWTTWLTLARIDARSGATRAALGELARVRQLNPYFTLFPQP